MQYYVYILTNKSNSVLYIGMTNDLIRRLYEHKEKLIEGFTKRYNIDKLVYYETTNEVEVAIEREKQLKKWSRKKKEWLIQINNPDWLDLSLNFE
ncbi:MAG: GIY-YIG nuclease family protein [Clostridia bacterium]|nr:GIY-YIG nuclease family protein [Clostridia bacterium]